MIGTDWHIDPDDLATYAAGAAGPAALASAEAHLGRCAECRAALTTEAARHAPAGDDAWARIADRIDSGNPILRRWPRLAAVSLASPPLATATATVAGLLVVLVVAARIGSPRFATTALVTLGPISPLVAAHLAFGPRVDPAGKMAAAAPIAAGRVAALRALAATLLACVAGLLVTPLTTIGSPVVWLLPALAGTAIAVAISTYVDATIPSVALGVAWLAAVGVWLAGAPRALRGVSPEGLVSHRTDVQLALVAATLVAGAVAVWHSQTEPHWGGMA